MTVDWELRHCENQGPSHEGAAQLSREQGLAHSKSPAAGDRSIAPETKRRQKQPPSNNGAAQVIIKQRSGPLGEKTVAGQIRNDDGGLINTMAQILHTGTHPTGARRCMGRLCLSVLELQARLQKDSSHIWAPIHRVEGTTRTRNRPSRPCSSDRT